MSTKGTKLNERIKEWKEKYGGVFEFQVDDKTCYLREPKMLDFKRAFSALQDDSEIAFGEEMLSALWLDGDIEVKTNDEYFLTARRDLTKLLKYDEAEIYEAENRQSKITIGDHSVNVRVITREDLKMAEKRNPSQKPFVTQEILFDMIKVDPVDEVFNDKNNPEIRFPLYTAIEKLQTKKVAQLKKL